MAKTIDNIGHNTHVSWAKAQDAIDKSWLDDLQSVGGSAAITAYTATHSSQVEALMGLDQTQQTWATIPPPNSYKGFAPYLFRGEFCILLKDQKQSLAMSSEELASDDEEIDLVAPLRALEAKTCNNHSLAQPLQDLMDQVKRLNEMSHYAHDKRSEFQRG